MQTIPLTQLYKKSRQVVEHEGLEEEDDRIYYTCRKHVWSKTYLHSSSPNPNSNPNPNTNSNSNPNSNRNPNSKAQFCFQTDEMT